MARQVAKLQTSSEVRTRETGQQGNSLKLIDAAHHQPLSQVLPRALSAARRLGDSEFADWIRLELSGYTSDNPAMTESTVVPEYRSVPGRHFDRAKRLIDIRDPRLSFLDTDRLRFGVGQLEDLARRSDTICVGDSAGMEIIRDSFDADPYAFCFEPTSVVGVLEAIRTNLLDQLEDRRQLLEPLERGETPDVGDRSTPSTARRVAGRVFGSVWRIMILVVAGLLVAFLAWLFGWS